jgi:hypothetical protein
MSTTDRHHDRSEPRTTRIAQRHLEGNLLRHDDRHRRMEGSPSVVRVSAARE